MSDNAIVANPGSGGATFASDQIGGIEYPRAKVVWGADGTATDTSAANPLPVVQTGALPAGTAAIGKLAANSGVDIGDVDVTSVPADPFGTNADAASATGSVSAKLRFIASTGIPVTGTVTVGSHAVTNAGTFAVQAAATLASGAVSSGALASGSVASGAVASGAVASGAFASGSIASGAVVDGGIVALGVTTGTKVVTDATGTVQQYLRGLVTFFANALGAGTEAAAIRVTLPTDGTGQVAVATKGFSAAVTLTRTADTNAYAANDILGSATGSTAALTFATIGPSAGRILITGASLEIDAAAVISGETSYLLHLYNVTPPSALGDNAAFDLPSGDRTSYLGSLNLGAPVDLGSTLYADNYGITKPIKLSGTSLFGYLVTVGGYTPTSARVHVVTLHTVRV